MLPQNKPDRIRILFDDHRLVANAGLLLPATLARHLGLRELVDHHLDLGGAPGRANTGDKMLTLVASALAGGDCIDDADALRAGGTVGVPGCVVKERMDLLELAASAFAVRNLSPEVALLRKGGTDGDVDFLREALRVLVEEIMDAEVSARTGAGYGERSPERVTQRNGYRSGAWDYPCRDDGSAHPEAQRRELLPEPAGATASQRASSAGCDPAGLRGRCIHKAGGRSGQGPGV